ncbi:MAG: hypothetical protein QXH12_00490 [Candidatus Caldarchaeum sp.]|uniref:Uncharacterized protein n=1 Tax=Caldiarchaeum subterraneum TaxID=311458 RepID=A0A7C5QD68_CALS0
MKYDERLEKAETFDDVYRLVKQLVMEKFGLRRAGMGLVLADLPNHLMAYHEMGSNAIVVNKTLLNAVSAITKSKKAVNSYIFVILLHEYLHTLGFDERQTRELVKEAVLSVFPVEHHVVRLATTSVYEVFPELKNIQLPPGSSKPVIVKDFDMEGVNYIG